MKPDLEMSHALSLLLLKKKEKGLLSSCFVETNFNFEDTKKKHSQQTL